MMSGFAWLPDGTSIVCPELGDRDLLVSYFPIDGPRGIDRAACILQDITDRKRMEEALSGVNRKLVDSQEQERTRIARELHDDIAQRLGILAISLNQLQRDPSEGVSSLRRLCEETAEIASDVQSISHELHTSKLELLGVVKGLKSWCREFELRQGIRIDLKTDASSALPVDIGLCLLRVLQEALQNAVKHSEVKRIKVQLTEHSSEVHLAVSDSGKGFEVEIAGQGRGLGLTSMRERVRLVNGTITIQSRPMGGTTIRVSVPFKASPSAQRAAG